jgi:hypothetical protein
MCYATQANMTGEGDRRPATSDQHRAMEKAKPARKNCHRHVTHESSITNPNAHRSTQVEVEISDVSQATT